MTVGEASEFKRQTEETIRDALDRFQKETGHSIDRIVFDVAVTIPVEAGRNTSRARIVDVFLVTRP